MYLSALLEQGVHLLGGRMKEIPVVVAEGDTKSQTYIIRTTDFDPFIKNASYVLEQKWMLPVIYLSTRQDQSLTIRAIMLDEIVTDCERRPRGSIRRREFSGRGKILSELLSFLEMKDELGEKPKDLPSNWADLELLVTCMSLLRVQLPSEKCSEFYTRYFDDNTVINLFKVINRDNPAEKQFDLVNNETIFAALMNASGFCLTPTSPCEYPCIDNKPVYLFTRSEHLKKAKVKLPVDALNGLPQSCVAMYENIGLCFEEDIEKRECIRQWWEFILQFAAYVDIHELEGEEDGILLLFDLTKESELMKYDIEIYRIPENRLFDFLNTFVHRNLIESIRLRGRELSRVYFDVADELIEGGTEVVLSFTIEKRAKEMPFPGPDSRMLWRVGVSVGYMEKKKRSQDGYRMYISPGEIGNTLFPEEWDVMRNLIANKKLVKVRFELCKENIFSDESSDCSGEPNSPVKIEDCVRRVVKLITDDIDVCFSSYDDGFVYTFIFNPQRTPGDSGKKLIALKAELKESVSEEKLRKYGLSSVD